MTDAEIQLLLIQEAFRGVCTFVRCPTEPFSRVPLTDWRRNSR